MSKARDLSRDMADLMSGIEYLHPLLGEQKQQIQGRVTWSESKLVIGNQAIVEEEGYNVGSDDRLKRMKNGSVPGIDEVCTEVIIAAEEDRVSWT